MNAQELKKRIKESIKLLQEAYNLLEDNGNVNTNKEDKEPPKGKIIWCYPDNRDCPDIIEGQFLGLGIIPPFGKMQFKSYVNVIANRVNGEVFVYIIKGYNIFKNNKHLKGKYVSVKKSELNNDTVSFSELNKVAKIHSYEVSYLILYYHRQAELKW